MKVIVFYYIFTAIQLQPATSTHDPTPLGCYRARSWAVLFSSFSLALSLSHVAVYTCQCYSLNLFHPLLLSLCPVCSLCLCLYSCPANGFINSIFSRFHEVKWSEYTQLCVLFVTPRTVTRKAPVSMELSRQEYWNGLPLPSPVDLPNPGLLHCRRLLYRLSHQGSCVNIQNVFFPFSDLLHSVTGSKFIHLNDFLWLSNIPFYITSLSIHLSMDI